MVKNLSAIKDTRVPFLGQEDLLEEEMANPLQYSWLENPRDGRAWQATVYGVAESDTTQQQRAPAKPGGDSPSSPLPASGVASILGLWLRQSSLCLYPHRASPLWAPLPSSHKDTNHLGTGAPSAQLITTNATCPQLCFQMRPHSQAVRTCTYLGDTGFNP